MRASRAMNERVRPHRFRRSASRGRRRLAAAVLAIAGFAWGAPAWAAGPDGARDRYPDLYTARVMAEDRGNVDLALVRAMRAMLVRVTGLRRPEASPGVRDAFANPERYVQQYLFESGADHDLTVKFDPDAIDRLVEELGLGRWSRVRPRVIVWLAVEDERGRKTYVDSASRAAVAIDEPAHERGMPFVLPLYDIEDRMTLPVSTLWGGFPEPIERASRRYAADAVLAGRAWRGDTGLWKARWTLFGELTREFRTSGESLEAAVAEGMHEVVDRFAARFARHGAAAASAGVPLEVAGVERLEDYGRLMGYLASIDIVETAQVERVEASRVRIVLRAKGGRPALAELIALGRTLVPAESAAGEDDEGASALDYQLR